MPEPMDPSSLSSEPLSEPRGIPWRLGLTLGVLALALAPLLVRHGQQLWQRPYYQFFPFALLGALWLAVTRLQGVGPSVPGPRNLAFVGMLLAWILLATATLLDSSWLGALACLGTLAAAAYAQGGRPLAARLLPALGLLAVLLPPPLDLDRSLVLLLQRLATQASSRLLDQLGVFHLLAGNVVEVSGQRLLVEEACTGVNSLFVVLAAALFYVFHVRRTLIWSLLLVSAALGWALLANVVRVTALVLFKIRYSVDLTMGWRHEALGLVLFVLILVLIWSTDHLLHFLLAPAKTLDSSSWPEELAQSEEPDIPQRDPPLLRPNLLRGTIVPGAYLGLAIFQGATLGWVGTPELPTPGADLSILNEETLPSRWGAWERQGFGREKRAPGSYFGEVSQVWAYARARGTVLVALDSPFPYWHDLTRCYTSQGWVVDQQQIHPGAENEAGYVEVVLSKTSYRAGYLLFAQFDGRGHPLPPRPGGLGLAVYRHTTTLDRWQHRLRGHPPPEEPEQPPIYQVQLFAETTTGLTEEEQIQARTFFRQILPRMTAPLTHLGE